MTPLKLPVAEIPAITGESMPVVYDAIRRGHLDTFLVGRRRFARPAAIQKWVDYLESESRKGRPVSYRARPESGHTGNGAAMSKPLRPYKTYEPGRVFANVVDNFRERDDTWAIGCCPFHGDRNPSLSMNLQTGWYRCNSSHCGATGRSIVQFIAELHGLDTQGALEYLEANYG